MSLENFPVIIGKTRSSATEGRSAFRRRRCATCQLSTSFSKNSSRASCRKSPLSMQSSVELRLVLLSSTSLYNSALTASRVRGIRRRWISSNCTMCCEDLLTFLTMLMLRNLPHGSSCRQTSMCRNCSSCVPRSSSSSASALPPKRISSATRLIT